MSIWKTAAKCLQANMKVVLLKVVFHKGSSPGKQGFEMLVCEDGTLFGTIGGGKVEYQLVELAKHRLKTGELSSKFVKQVHREDDFHSSGMFCAGEQWVILFPIFQKHAALINIILNQNSGGFKITPDSISFQDEISDIQFDIHSENDWVYQERMLKKSLLYLIGGGHVGLATAKIFQDLDFEVTMFDNRDGLNTFEQNIFSKSKQIIDFKDIARVITEGNQTYIVILTHNFESDAEVLKSLQYSDLKYIGVLGSKSKINLMFNDMAKSGVSEAFLKRIDAPVGISINSKTPAEIGISIAAKLIQVRNSA